MLLKQKIKTIVFSVILLFSFTTAVAFAADEYTILNDAVQDTMMSLKESSPSIILGNYHSVDNELAIYQSEYTQSGNAMVQYSILTSSKGIVMPYFEISLNPDKYDPATEVAICANNFFSKITPKATTAMAKEFMRLVNLAISASEYKVMGYDSTKYLISEVEGTIIGLTFIYSAGDSFSFVCYMNLPEASLHTGNTYTVESLNAQIQHEKDRELHTWFMYGNQITDVFVIEDSKWEIAWEILSIVEGKSVYSITVLDDKDNIIQTIDVPLDSLLNSVILTGPGNFKLKTSAEYGNWYVRIKQIPDKN